MKPKILNRTCPQCGTKFSTTDKRKKYCKRSCGNTHRSKRWYDRASEALRNAAVATT